MVKIEVIYEGGQKTRVVDMFTGVTIRTDAEREKNFHPLDLCLISLATSLMSDCVNALIDKNVKIPQMSADLEYEMQREPVYRVKSVSIKYKATNNLNDNEKELILQVLNNTNIIRGALHSDITVAITCAWE